MPRPLGLAAALLLALPPLSPALAQTPDSAAAGPAAAALAAAPPEPAVPLVRNLDRPWTPTAGLAGRHVAVWPSHGWYYEPSLDRWEWQRARVFTTVEDLLPFAFVQPFLVPEIERAGGLAFLPRERDTQPHEVVADGADSITDGRPGGASIGRTRGWRELAGPAYGIGRRPYGPGVNPFALGTAEAAPTARAATDSVVWSLDVPATGDYAVRVAYTHGPDRARDARYTVHHAGGATRFAVDQTRGGGTWVHLGTFRFLRGEGARVVLTNESAAPGRRVVADAVRLGGGLGVVARGGRASGRPAWMEAARYHLQAAGAPDSSVVRVATLDPEADEPGPDDYKDDYQGRSEWVNWLAASTTGGDGRGPSGAEDAPGLGLPIDLALAFHTDAGTTPDSTVVGTLMIYNSKGMDDSGRFPDGSARGPAARRLAGGVQTGVVRDIRALWDPAWVRRDLWNRGYSEATRPKVPAALLELLSHHNWADMRYALDPRFRHDASRAIYKSVLRFVAQRDGFAPVVQPLPVSHLSMEIQGAEARVRWRPTDDPLEPSARPLAYVVYTRLDDRGWDNGRLVEAPGLGARPEARVPLPEGRVVSVRVGAVNAGGESAPSAAVAACRCGGGAETLVVDGFSRVAPPAELATDSLRGFVRAWDPGVADGLDLATVGDQYEFGRTVEWQDDDEPGHGASHADLETTVWMGNGRDHAAAHGRALQILGRPFASATADAVADGDVALERYVAVSLDLGEQRRTRSPVAARRPAAFAAWPDALRARLGAYLQGGGALVASGAYLGTDAAQAGDGGATVRWLARYLGVAPRTDHASRAGEVESVDRRVLPRFERVPYQAAPSREVYAVEAPDGLVPVEGRGTRTVLRYPDTQVSAAVVGRRTAAVGVPLAAIPTDAARARLLGALLDAVRR